jgi:hypothetical protein
METKNNTSSLLHHRATILASGHYLTDRLPEDSKDWDEDRYMQFIEDHKWEPFEYWRAEDVEEEIDSLACTLVRFAKETTNERKALQSCLEYIKDISDNDNVYDAEGVATPIKEIEALLR